MNISAIPICFQKPMLSPGVYFAAEPPEKLYIEKPPQPPAKIYKTLDRLKDLVSRPLDKLFPAKPKAAESPSLAEVPATSPVIQLSLPGDSGPKTYSIDLGVLPQVMSHMGRDYYQDEAGQASGSLRVLAMANPTPECLSVFSRRLSDKETDRAQALTESFLKKLAAKTDWSDGQQAVLDTGLTVREIKPYLESLSVLTNGYDKKTKALPSFSTLLNARQWINAILSTQENPNPTSWLAPPMRFEVKTEK